MQSAALEAEMTRKGRNNGSMECQRKRRENSWLLQLYKLHSVICERFPNGLAILALQGIILLKYIPHAGYS